MQRNEFREIPLSEPILRRLPNRLCEDNARGPFPSLHLIAFASDEDLMSKRETGMTEGFWQLGAHGLFFAEYPLVHRAPDRSTRLVDGLILPDEPHRRGKWREHRNRYPNQSWPYGNVSNGPSALFCTLSSRLRCGVGPINFIVPSARWCITPASEAISRSRSLVIRSA